jgi:hypothetical protein
MDATAMPAAVALIGFDPAVHELLEALLADAGYAVAPAVRADVAIVHAGLRFAARPVVEALAATPVVLLTTALVEHAPGNVRAVVAMPFDADGLLAAVARALAG